MNLLGGYIKGLLGKKSLGRNPMWESIELMPYWNWKQVIETGDLRFIYKSCEGRVGKRLIELWEDLQDQHIQTFGLESALIQNIRSKKKVCKLINKYIQTKDRFLLNLIEIEQSKLEEETEPVKTHKIKGIIEQYKGFRVVVTPNKGKDSNQITVVEWYSAIKSIKEQNG